MGMSMRNANWRLTEWCPFDYVKAYPKWTEDAFGCQLELYPHEGDDGKDRLVGDIAFDEVQHAKAVNVSRPAMVTKVASGQLATVAE